MSVSLSLLGALVFTCDSYLRMYTVEISIKVLLFLFCLDGCMG